MNYVLRVGYDGGHFFGFQRQSDRASVQGVLERALSEIFAETVTIQGAGRTDTGVHAVGQVVAFQSDKSRPLGGIATAINRSCRPHLFVSKVARLKPSVDFHPRYHALRRAYSYFLACGGAPEYQNFWVPRAARLAVVPDLEAMRAGAQALLGQHDFRSYSSRCELDNTIRELYHLEVTLVEFAAHKAAFLRIDIEANGFLRRMVRILTSALVKVGLGEYDPNKLRLILEAKEPGEAPPPAPAHGLYFRAVEYPEDPFCSSALAEECFQAPQICDFARPGSLTSLGEPGDKD